MPAPRLWFLGQRWVPASTYFQSSSGFSTADAFRFSNYVSPCPHQKMSAPTLSYPVLPLEEGSVSSGIAGTPKCPTEHMGGGGGFHRLSPVTLWASARASSSQGPRNSAHLTLLFTAAHPTFSSQVLTVRGWVSVELFLAFLLLQKSSAKELLLLLLLLKFLWGNRK